MSSENILFSASDLVPAATLSSSAEPSTPLAWLQGSARARKTRWASLEAPVVLSGTFAASAPIAYLAVPGHNLRVDALVQVRLYDAEDAALYVSEWLAVGDFLPAGLFRAGVDKFGVRARVPNNTLFHAFPRVLNAIRFEVEFDHMLDFVPPEAGEPTAVSDGVYRQDGASGVLSIEAENGVAEAVGSDAWEIAESGSASGGLRRTKTGPEFYWTPLEGPLMRFVFTATASGSHRIWLRLASTDGNSIYTTFDGTSKTSVYDRVPFIAGGHKWKNTMTVNLTKGSRHEIVVSARDHYMSLDKLVVQPAGAAEPTDTGPAESGFGTRLVYEDFERTPSREFLELRSVMLGDTLQLDRTFRHGAPIRFQTDPDLTEASSGYQLAGRAQREVRTGSVDLTMMSERDALRLVELALERAGRPVIVALYPGGTDWVRAKHTFLARFGTALEVVNADAGIHSTRLLLHEA